MGAGAPDFGLASGAIFAGEFRIVRPLAEGGMGAVYVVDQLSTGKTCALKVMRPELAGDEELRSRFRLEAKVGAQLASEHVVHIHTAGVDEATRAPYLAMEVLLGEDLATRLERGPLARDETRELFRQLCDAVGAAHDAGIVHRDLKPANVFLAKPKNKSSAGFHVKVLDFGIAKIAAESMTKGHTTTGMIGTPLWMSPEQTEKGKITPAADVWALGLILYNVLTAQIYWQSASDPEATFAQVMKEVVMGPLPIPSARAREQGASALWPEALDRLFSRCLERDASRRIPTAKDFFTALEEGLARESSMESAAQASSARVNAGAPASSAFDRTTPAAPPPSSPAVPPPSPAARPAIVLPPVPQQPAVLSSRLGGLPDVLGVPLPAVLGGAGVLLVIAIIALANISMRMKLQPPPEPDNGDHDEAADLGAARPPTQPVGAAPKCRLCTGDVLATGPLARETIIASMERYFPLLDRQCLERASRRVSAGTTRLRFVVREGVAGNRNVVSTTSRDGADECLMRAIGDVRFPNLGEGTEVSYVFVYDPSVR